jgi:hypothetical protein
MQLLQFAAAALGLFVRTSAARSAARIGGTGALHR